MSYYPDNDQRKINLEYVLKWLNQNRSKETFEIIIVEQGDKKTLNENISDKYILINKSRGFNRSKGFNKGAEISAYNRLVFGDIDLIMDFDALLKAINLPYQAVNPKNKVIYLEPNKLPPSEGTVYPTNFAGGILILDKDAWKLIGGWNERYEGWGVEDDEMTFKINDNLKFITENNNAYHLWHPKLPLVPELYQNNKRVLGEYFSSKEKK